MTCTNRHRLACSLLIAAGITTALTGCRIPVAPADAAPPESTVTAALPIAPEDTEAEEDYDRDDWPHWSYHGHGCDTRELVLQRQGQDVTIGEDCEVLSGTWVSQYDHATVTAPSDLDVDHIVPLAEAARSGAGDWTETQRETYANDLAVLVAVTASSNRSKGDSDPTDWLPEHDQCGYLARWVAIKHRYALTADRVEADAIAAANCPS